MTQLLLDRKLAPLIHSPLEFDFNLQNVQEIDFKNKTKVYVLNSDKSGVVHLEFIFQAGAIKTQNPLVANFTNSLLKSGTNQHSALEIDEYFEHYGAYIERNCFAEYASISIKMLSKYLPHIIVLLKEILTQTIFPEKEILLLKNKAQRSLKMNLQKADYVANHKINELLFGFQNVYGKSVKQEDYDLIERSQILDFYHTHYLQGACKIFISGNVSNHLLQEIELHFGDLPFRKWNDVFQEQTIMTTNEKSNWIEINKESVQSSIRIGRIFGSRNNPNFFKARVLNMILGGYFGSRLMETIREEKGFAYGIYSYIQQNLGSCGWIISTETGRHVSKEAIFHIYDEMQKLQKEKVDIEELNLVKNYYLGSIMGDIEGTLPIMNIWKNLILHQQNITYFNQFINTLKNISSEEILEVAQKYLNPADFIELVVE